MKNTVCWDVTLSGQKFTDASEERDVINFTM